MRGSQVPQLDAIDSLAIKDKIPDMDIDNWFRSHKFIYAMMSKHVKAELEDMDMLTFDVGTIESIAMKTRDAFRDFQEK